MLPTDMILKDCYGKTGFTYCKGLGIEKVESLIKDSNSVDVGIWDYLELVVFRKIQIKYNSVIIGQIYTYRYTGWPAFIATNENRR